MTRIFRPLKDLFDSDHGNPTGNDPLTLGGLAHGSANLGPLLGLQGLTGLVEIISSTPVISLSLNAEAFPVFSSLPPGTIILQGACS